MCSEVWLPAGADGYGGPAVMMGAPYVYGWLRRGQRPPRGGLLSHDRGMKESPSGGGAAMYQRSDVRHAPIWDSEPPLILVADPDSEACREFKEHCQDRGATVLTAETGADALISFGRHAPELILISDQLAGFSWKDVVAGIRAQSDVPIILGTAGASREVAYALGVTDVLRRPYLCAETSTVLDQVLRNGLRRRAPDAVLTVGQLTMVTDAFEVTVDGKSIPLTLREFELLRVLMLHADAVVSAGQIKSDVWGVLGEDVRTATLKVHVGRLRAKLGGAARIVTVRGLGYRLVAQG